MLWVLSFIRNFITGVWNNRISVKSRDSVPSLDWLTEYSDLGIYEGAMEVEESFEKCLEVNGELVASTVIRDNGRLKSTAKSRIDPKDPLFSTRKESILAVCQAIFYIVSEHQTDLKDNDAGDTEGNTTGIITGEQPRKSMLCTGTAILIGKSLLLTAGHAVSSKGSRVYALPPGFEAPLIDASGVWDGKNLDQSRYTFEVVDRIFEPSGSDYIDLAVLKIDSVCFPHPVTLDYTVKPRQGTPIDVIGYPSNYNEKWIKKAHGQINDVQSSFQDVLSLLPKWRVVTSTGEIISVGKNNIRYKLSTTPGMSGAAVLYEGKVIGVHFGVDKQGNNRCVRLSGKAGDMVKRALKT